MKTACEALLTSGGILYVHQNVTSRISIENVSCKVCKILVERTKCNLHEKLEVSKIKLSKKSDFELEFVVDSFIKWKYSEWFIYSIHLSHVILDILEKNNSNKWSVCVDEVIKVKSYAPHIDHLVFTVICKS